MFNPDQPRDDLGRWTDTGMSGSITKTGSTEIVTTHKDAGAALKAAASDYTAEAAILQQALELNRKAIEARPEFEDKLKLVNSFLNGQETGINLKKVDRISEKAVKEYNGNVNDVTDAIRSTIVIDNKEKYNTAIDAFKKAGAVKVKLQEGSAFLGYTGVLAKFKLNNGIYAEVQANYPEMLYAKEKPEDAKRLIGDKKWSEINSTKKIDGGLGHKYYEQYRSYQDKIRMGSLTNTEADYLAEIESKSMQYYAKFY